LLLLRADITAPSPPLTLDCLEVAIDDGIGAAVADDDVLSESGDEDRIQGGIAVDNMTIICQLKVR